ncbi:MAG: hypothetical protein F4X02_15360 [Chloroflexi bacterium]|nr:hypothetical protein [Chloroflexota bacterium]
MTLVLDWLAREGHLLLLWWLWLTLAGAAMLPVALRYLSALPDGGYTLARALGLLVTTWLYWLLGSFGFFDNSVGSIILTWLLVVAGSLALYFRNRGSGLFSRWWRENRNLVVVAELLFAVLFLGWALYRAHQNDLVGTEKPMELAFLSATQRSAGFPPNDPWMSGYAISYYYMGYIMSSALSTLSGIGSTVGFNLTVASQFALTGLATFGVVCNLVRSRAASAPGDWRSRMASGVTAMATGFAGVLIMLLMGNYQLLLIELPLASRSAPPSYFEIWDTQKLPDFDLIDYQPGASAALNLDTSSWNHWWWFNASRVPTDYDLNDRLTGIQPISEFPAFSFILSDNHPHVLSLPFVIVAIGLMLNIALSRGEPSAHQLILYGVMVGGLAFLNAWDAPTLLLGLVGAEALRRLMTSDNGRLALRDWLALIKFGALIAFVAAAAYLPYFVGFRSQAGGILPNLLHPALFQRFFIMFGPLFVILSAYLLVECWRGRAAHLLNWRLGFKVGVGLLLGMLALMIVLSGAIAIGSPDASISGNFVSARQLSGEVAGQLVQRRLDYGLTSLLLALGVGIVVARLFPDKDRAAKSGEVAFNWLSYPISTGFVMLLIGMGLCLTLFCEFFYLRDNFYVRINTVFKLYYQAWALWSIAAAYALYSVLLKRGLPSPHAVVRLALGILFLLSVCGGLLYGVTATRHRAWIETGRQFALQRQRYAPPSEWAHANRQVYNGERVERGTVLYSRVALADASEADLLRAETPGIAVFDGDNILIQEPLTLDGADGLLPFNDQQVITCLDEIVGRSDAVVAEAVGEAYNVAYGRVGTLAGIPVVLGWENHERQWRGATYSDIAGSRASDLKELYTRHEMSAVQHILERYSISHIMYGATERQRYGSLGEEKFLDHLPVVCESGNSRIFQVRAAG